MPEDVVIAYTVRLEDSGEANGIIRVPPDLSEDQINSRILMDLFYVDYEKMTEAELKNRRDLY
jgi:hypothetical protein